MVTEMGFKGETAFQCGVCGMKYREKENAEKCQSHCEKNPGTCSIEVAEKAIKE